MADPVGLPPLPQGVPGEGLFPDPEFDDILGPTLPDQLNPTLIRRPDNDPGAITKVLGVPVGLQLGTAVGLTGLGAFAVDIASDPLTYINPFSGLSKLFRGGNELLSTSTRFDNLLLSLAKDQNLTPRKAVKKLFSGLSLATRLDTAPLKSLERMVRQGDTDGIAEVIRLANRNQFSKIKNDAAFPGVKTLRRVQDLMRRGDRNEAISLVRRAREERVQLQGQVKKFMRDPNTTAEQKKELQDRLKKLEPSLQYRAFSGKDTRSLLEGVMKDTKKNRATRRRSTSRNVRNALDARISGLSDPQRAAMRLRLPKADVSEMFSVSTGPKGVPIPKDGKLLRVENEEILKESSPGFEASAKAQLEEFKKDNNLSSKLVLGRMSDIVIRNFLRPSEDMLHSRAARDMGEVMAEEVNGGRILAERIVNELEVMASGAQRSDILRDERAGGTFIEKVFDILEDPKSVGLDLDELAETGGKKIGPSFPGVPGIKTSQVKREFADATLTDAAKKAGVTEKHLEAAGALRSMLLQMGQVAKEDGFIQALIERYAPRSVRIKDEVEFDAFMAGKNADTPTAQKTFRFGFERKLLFRSELKQLADEGIVEMKSAKDTLKEYITSLVETSAQARFSSRMAAARVPKERSLVTKAVSKEAAEQFGLDTVPLIAGRASPFVKANPKLYVKTRDPRVNSFAKQMALPDLGRGDTVMVHKDFRREIPITLSPLFQEGPTGSTNPVFNGLVKTNAAMKRILLGFSAFHAQALAENSIVSIGGVKAFGQLFSTISGRSIGQRNLWEAGEVLELGARSGLVLGPLPDMMAKLGNEVISDIAKKVPGTSDLQRTVAKLTTTWDRGMWDFYHSGLKLSTFATLYDNALQKFGAKFSKEQIARGVADHVNNAFGGQLWERMLVNRKMENWARLVLLAPDWTFSNLRVATDVFGNLFRKQEWFQKTRRWAGFQVSPEELVRGEIRGYYARRYAFNTVTTLYPFLNMVNHAFSGKFMWDNPEGKKLEIQLPFTDEKDRPLFVNTGKQFKEVLELAGITGDPKRQGPQAFLQRKLARLPTTATTVITRQDMFGKPIVAQDDGPLMQMLKTSGLLAMGSLPIPMQEAFDMGRITNDFNGNIVVRDGQTPVQRGLGAIGFRARPDFDASPDFTGVPLPSPLQDLFGNRDFLKDVQSSDQRLRGNRSFKAPLANLPVAR